MTKNKFFHYKKGRLFCEGVSVESIAKKVGTPFYLYSQSSFEERFLELKKSLKPINPLICYAMKANSNLSVLKTLVKLGAGMDIVSGGELFRALKAGCPANKIVYAGVGKTRREIQAGIKAGIFSFNVESLPELEMIQKEAEKKRKEVRVALRINPDVDAKTHKKITTGKAENKFGIDIKTAEKIFFSCQKYPNLRIGGIHVHIGSQITKAEPFIKALKKVLVFVDSLEKKGVQIDSLDLGGGLGIVYHNESPAPVKKYGAQIVSLVKNKPYKMIFEPGRFIAGNSGALVSEVSFTKRTPKKNFIVVDAAMNDLMRPAIYDAYHEVFSVKSTKRKKIVADIVGPICETGDVLAYARKIEDVQPAELVAIMSAGAYGFSMASNYNSRPRPAEVMVKGSKFRVVRKAETYQNLISGEI